VAGTYGSDAEISHRVRLKVMVVESGNFFETKHMGIYRVSKNSSYDTQRSGLYIL
jgi:hypothetical protein